MTNISVSHSVVISNLTFIFLYKTIVSVSADGDVVVKNIPEESMLPRSRSTSGILEDLT